MKLIESKFHLLIFGGNTEPDTLDLGSVQIVQGIEGKAQRMVIDIDLNFKTHV